MRNYIAIPLLSLSLLCAGQTDSLKCISLEEALLRALRQNPSAMNPEGKKILIRDVKATYYHMVYLGQKMNTLRAHLALIGDLPRVAALRHETGDIDLLEEIMLIARFDRVNTEFSVLSDEISIVRNKLKMYLITNENFIPADTLCTLYQINKTPPQPPGETSADETVHASFTENLTIENLRYALNASFKKLTHVNTYAREASVVMLETAKTKLKKEEIEYCEFTELVDKAFALKTIYLDTLDAYNQTAIQLEFHAY
jgi:hypothetical protein